MRSKIYLIILFAVIAGTLPAQTLLAEYKFTGASGTDNSGNGNTGTIYGSSTTGNTLEIGSNVSDYFTMPASLLNNKLAFSISFSVKFTGLNNNGVINTNHIISGDNPGIEGAVALSYQKNLNLWRFVLNGSLYDFSDSNINAGQWYCVAVTRDASGLIKMYLDGVQYQTTYTSTWTTYVTSLLVGQETDCTGGCFDATQCTFGMIDDLRFYSGAISPATVTANCNNCTTPANPVDITSPANLQICSGNSATLNVSSNDTIQWFDAAGPSATLLATGPVLVTNMLSTGTYTFYAGALGCAPSASRTAIQLTVNPLPVIFLSGQTQLCTGQAGNLSASGALTYSWSSGETTSSITIVPFANTSYTVTGTNQYGCSSLSIVNVQVHECTGISELSQDESYRVYPNPAASDLNITAASACAIEVRNQVGMLVMSGKLQPGDNQLKVQDWPQGIYMVRLSGGDNPKSLRIVVAH